MTCYYDLKSSTQETLFILYKQGLLKLNLEKARQNPEKFLHLIRDFLELQTFEFDSDCSGSTFDRKDEYPCKGRMEAILIQLNQWALLEIDHHRGAELTGLDSGKVWNFFSELDHQTRPYYRDYVTVEEKHIIINKLGLYSPQYPFE